MTIFLVPLKPTNSENKRADLLKNPQRKKGRHKNKTDYSI